VEKRAFFRRLPAAILVIAACFGLSPRLEAVVPQKIYIKGLQLLRDEQFQEARRYFEECIRRQGREDALTITKGRYLTYLPHMRLAQVLLAIGEREAAAQEFEISREQGVAEKVETKDFQSLDGALKGITIPSVATIDAPPELPPKTPQEAHLPPTPVPAEEGASGLPAPAVSGSLERISEDGEIFFEWPAVDGAKSYLVEKSPDSDFGDPERKEVPTGPFWDEIEAGQLRFFRVAAIDAEDKEGEFSSPISFRRLPEILAEPIRWKPGERKVIAGGSFVASWDAIPGVDAYDVELRVGKNLRETLRVEEAMVELDVPDEGTFELLVVPVLGDEEGIPAKSTWKVVQGLAAPEAQWKEVEGEITWGPVDSAAFYSLRYAFGSADPDLFFGRVENCEDECRLVLRGGLEEGVYSFGIRAEDDKGGKSTETVIRVSLNNLDQDSIELLKQARRMVVEQDDMKALKFLSANREKLETAAEYHLLLGIACWEASELGDPLPVELGNDAKAAMTKEFQRAIEINPDIEFPEEEMGALKDLLRAFEAARGQ